jgi:hypothetical protein
VLPSGARQTTRLRNGPQPSALSAVHRPASRLSVSCLGAADGVGLTACQPYWGAVVPKICGADVTPGCVLAPLRNRVPAGTVSVAMAEQHETAREFSAVPLVVVVFAILAAVAGGIWIGLWAAIVVTVGFALLAIAALTVWSLRRERLGEPPQVTPIEDGRYRILVVADERCATASFAAELRSHAGGRPLSVFIMAPALESRVGRLAGDQQSYEDATRRVNEIVEGLKGADAEARGEVGPSDPLQAADDGLRQFAANEIVFVTHPEGQGNWLERGVVTTAKSRYFQPVKHILVAGG